MTVWTERAFDTATEISRQVLTLSAAIVALSFTFLTDVISESSTVFYLFVVSWLFFGLSIVFSFFTLMSLTGSLAEIEKNSRIQKEGDDNQPESVEKTVGDEVVSDLHSEGNQATPDIYRKGTRWCAGLQFASFLIALILTGVAMALGVYPEVQSSVVMR